MSKETRKIIFNILIVIVIALLAFYAGRKTYVIPQTDTKVEYLEGKTIHHFISFPTPYMVFCPCDTVDIIRKCVKDGIYSELFPEKNKEKTVYITKEDTTAIMRDWAAERLYSETLFDTDTLGKMTINTEIQYNRIKNYSYDFTPKTKTIVQKNYIVKGFSPYVGVGISFNPWDEIKDPMPKISAGFFVKEKIGFQADFQHGVVSKKDFVGCSILVKF